MKKLLAIVLALAVLLCALLALIDGFMLSFYSFSMQARRSPCGALPRPFLSCLAGSAACGSGGRQANIGRIQ